MGPEAVGRSLSRTVDLLERVRAEWRPEPQTREHGTLVSVQQGIARVTGLRQARSEEALLLGGKIPGLVFDLDEEDLGVALLGDGSALAAGQDARRVTGQGLDVPVGDALLGRVIDPLGRPLDGLGPIRASQRAPIERDAPAILDRAPVSLPLQTGLLVVDALVPIGRGQRELILGDRQTGKTALAIDVILNQRDTGVVCVYCAIGQRGASVARVIGDLRRRGALRHAVVVVAHGDDAPGLRYVAPYAATAMAEHFMRSGRHALIVYDDLTNHARAYRELSLLFRRPPGREAFPGDIFYVHARLLERATQLRPELGGGSLTALPILETEAQNLSAYIPTNLISITDGQILLSSDLFRKGNLPAVDVGKSVSRVGGKAQLAAFAAVAGDLKLAYSQFMELESFARFGTRLDAATRKIIEHGRRIRECFKQNQYAPLSVREQILLLIALERGWLDAIHPEQIAKAKAALITAANSVSDSLRQSLAESKPLDAEQEEELSSAAKKALADSGAGT